MDALSLYFDYAAATPMDPQVQAAMAPFWHDKFYNPSATYLAAQAVKKDLDAARASIASWLGARPSEVIFTAGGTEANNLAIHGIMRQHPDAHVITSAIEHESVLQPARAYNYTEAPVTPPGLVDLDRLRELIDDQTVLVSIMYANNEVGTVQPIRAISQLIAAVRKDRRTRGVELPIYLHTDACQAAAYLDLHTARLGVDLLTLNAGKIYGPKQCGALFVESHVRVQPDILGGGQERNLRSGTENVAGAIGFAKALDLVQSRRHEEGVRLAALQDLFYNELKKAVPGATVNGTRKTRLPNNIHITIPGTDNERLLMQLDEAGILCAAGSACSASNEEASHVLRAMGLSDAEARASLRLTMGRHTTEEAVRHAVAALRDICAQKQSN
ncbi:MAG TPA: cysteine desulfurase family protein [Candidatus Saccharimonadales bacterium]|nr:cysteine desulfurase family protein [Candidatus Saccharimonadales bacterium]